MTLCFQSPTDPAGSQVGWHPGSFRRPPGSRFSSRVATLNHIGFDFMANAGAPVLASLPGTVVEVGVGDRSPPFSNVTPGYFVAVRTDIAGDRPVWTRYWHLQSQPRVTRGQTVSAGTLLGFVGTSGLPRGSQPHVMVSFSRFGPGPTDPPGAPLSMLGFQVEGAQAPPVRIGDWESTPAFGGRIVSACAPGAALGRLGEPPRLNNYARYGTTRLSNRAPYDPEGRESSGSGSAWIVATAAVIALVVGATLGPR